MSPPAARRTAWAAAAGVGLVAALVYVPTLGHGFAFDDATEIVQNDLVRSLANVPRMFASGAWEGAGDPNPIYRPLTSVTYALNHALGGLSPLGYHLGNVLLHAAVSALVLALGLRLGLGVGAAAVGALVFAVHPVHVEVVANVAGRKDALATGFAILAVLAHAAALRRGRAWTVLPPLLLAAALFSKEIGAAALGGIAAWDVLVDPDAWRSRRRRAVALYGVYAAVAALYLLARRAAVGSLGVPLSAIPLVENPLAYAPTSERLLTAVAMLGRGLALLVFPRTLSPDYSYDAIPLVGSPLDGRFLAGAAAILVLGAAAIRARRAWPLLAFAAAWYAAAIFPASNLLVRVGTVFGERLLYLPSVGFCLALGALAGRAADAARTPALRRGLGVAVAATLVALTLRTVAYAAVWSDEVSLFRAAVAAQPASAKAHELLGAGYMERDDLADGARELETAVALLSRLPRPPPDARVKLGVAYERLGRHADAVAQYETVLADAPDHPDALWRLGVVRWAEGRRDEAVRLWERTVAVAPGHARALSDLGIAAYARDDVAAAESLWLRAARADPHAAGPWLSLGLLYERRGELARAREAWRTFLDRAGYGAYPREKRLIEERLRALGDGAVPR